MPAEDESPDFIEIEGLGELYYDGLYWNGELLLEEWKEYDLHWVQALSEAGDDEEEDETSLGDRWQDVDEVELEELRAEAEHNPEAKELLESLLNDEDPPAGHVALSFSLLDDEELDADINAVPPPPYPEQLAAAKYALENVDHVKDIILNHVYEEYPIYREQAEEFDDEALPELTSAAGLKDHMRLVGINPLTVTKDGAAYTAYYFTASWDLEEGLGIIMHNDRIIVTGLTEPEHDVNLLIEDGGDEIEAP